MYKNYLFDLDGTLLPMDMEKFVEIYLASICKKFAPNIGIDPKLFAKGIWKGSGAMGKNDGDCLNIEVFWRTMNDRQQALRRTPKRVLSLSSSTAAR